MFNLWLDDVRDPDNFISIRKSYMDNGLKWVWVKTVQEAISVLKTKQVEIASLDHDLWFNETNNDQELNTKTIDKLECGRDVVLFLINEALDGNDYWPTKGTFVHSANPVGKEWMEGMINRYGPYEKMCNGQDKHDIYMKTRSTMGVGAVNML